MANNLIAKDGHLILGGTYRALNIPSTRLPFYRIDKYSKAVTTDGYFLNTPTESVLYGPEDVVIPTNFGLWAATSIADYAFNLNYGNNLIKSVTIPSGIVKIGANAFTGNYGITSIALPATVLEIGDSAFMYCGFTTVTIPDTVTKMGASVFANADVPWNVPSITSVTLGSGITQIQPDTFANHPITSITIGANVQIAATNISFPGTHPMGQFGSDFAYAYTHTYGSAAGTYNYSGGVWTKQVD